MGQRRTRYISDLLDGSPNRELMDFGSSNHLVSEMLHTIQLARQGLALRNGQTGSMKRTKNFFAVHCKTISNTYNGQQIYILQKLVLYTM